MFMLPLVPVSHSVCSIEKIPSVRVSMSSLPRFAATSQGMFCNISPPVVSPYLSSSPIDSHSLILSVYSSLSLTRCLSLTRSLSLCHSLTRSLSLRHSLSKVFLSHSLSHFLSHSVTLQLVQLHQLSMLTQAQWIINKNRKKGHWILKRAQIATCNQKIRSWFNPKSQIIHQDITSGCYNLNLGAPSLIKHEKHNVKSRLIDSWADLTYLDTIKFNVVSFTYAISTCISLQGRFLIHQA